MDICKLLFDKFVQVKLEDKYEMKNDELFYLLFAQQAQGNWFGSRRFHARQRTFLNMEYTQFTMVKAQSLKATGAHFHKVEQQRSQQADRGGFLII